MGPSELLVLSVVLIVVFAVVANVAYRLWDEIQDSRFEQSLRRESVKLEALPRHVRSHRH